MLKIAHEAMIAKVTPSEPHVDTSTSFSQNAILPLLVLVIHLCITLAHLVMNCFPCLVALTMKLILPLVLVLRLTM